MTFRFRTPKFIPALGTLVAVLITFTLAVWQLQRLEWKNQLIANIDAAQSLPPKALLSFAPEELTQSEWHNVLASGTLLHEKELFATPRYLNEHMGYAVLTPLAITTSDGVRYVLVNRGWVAPESKEREKRMAGNPTDTVTVEGAIRVPMQKKYFTPENHPERNLWFWYDLPAMSKELNLPLLPVMIDATAVRSADGKTLTEGPTPFPITINIRNDHMGYAITWFLIGLTAIGVFVAYHLERR